MISAGLPGAADADAHVVVVGGGPAGLTLALELAAHGLRVLVLESGGIGAGSAADLSAADVADPRVHDEVQITVSRQLGGTSNLWGARCQPYDPIDFEDRPWVSKHRWPISHADLAPWYVRACSLVECGEPVFVAPSAAVSGGDARVDAQRTERFSRQPKVQLAHEQRLSSDERIDIRLHCTVVGVELGEQDQVEALIVVGVDGVRHRLRARHVVLAMGGLETTRLLLCMQKARPSLMGGPDGPLGRYYMAHVIGEVSDITWANRALDEAYDFFIEGSSYVRRRMIPSDTSQREHQLPNVSFWPVVPPVADARHGSALLSAVFLAMAIRPVGRRLVAEAIRRYHAPLGTPWGPHVRNVLSGIPSAAVGSARFMVSRYLRRPRVPGFFVRNPALTYGLSYHSEHFPCADSRVSLSHKADRLGMPRLHVDLRFDRRDAEALFRAHELMAHWLNANGLGTLRYRQPAEETVDAILATARHGTHQIGTARMAVAPGEGVVDDQLAVFGVRGLHVASSAVLPTSGQANPTLTVVALAARLAAHLASTVLRRP